jgi:PTH1 family peptidyl-tRNA hydrolase
MKLIVGLGNPGPKYETTRHNIGFLCIDYLVEAYKASGPVIKNQAEVWTTKIDGEPALLIKPLTYMNLSGRAVAPFFQFYKCESSDVIVIHDELDFPPNDVRFKTGGSAGGHNGLKSMDECLGSDHTNYYRVRLGIGHPRNFNLKMDVSDYVLGKIPDQEWAELEDVFKKVDGGVRLILKGKILEAMTKYHAKPQPKN